MYDPATKKLTHIGTCFGTHHLMFAEDANHTLWTSGGGQVIGWLNTKMFDETQDEMKSQGWTALIRDANGNGKRDAYVEPNQPLDPDQGSAHRRRALRRRAGARRLDLGHAARLPGGGHPAVAGRESARDGDHRDLSAAGRQGLLAARRRRRSQRRVLGGDGQRPPGQLRSPQVQGPAERSERHAASIAPKAGPSTPSRCRSSRA